MPRAKPWQFSIKTIGITMLVIGPLAGAFAGTFGSAIREVLIMMVVVFFISLGLAVISTVIAFLLISPLLFMERFLRSSQEPRTMLLEPRVEPVQRVGPADEKGPA